MNPVKIRVALMSAYRDLEPYSKKYTVDIDRYLISLGLITSIPELQGKRILDIGTGIGIVPLALRKLGYDAEGLDYYIFPDAENEMFGLPNIAIYQKVWAREGLKVHNFDIYDPKTKETLGQYDVVLNEATIEHVKDPKKFIETCKNLTIAGGHILISTPNCATILKRIRFLFGKSPYWPIADFYESGEAFTGHWREYTLDELCYMCKKSGLTIVSALNLNAIVKFKSLRHLRKNIRAVASLIAILIPGSREMHFVLAQTAKE